MEISPQISAVSLTQMQSESPDYSKNYLVHIISGILTELVQESSSPNLIFRSKFNCKSPPRVSIQKYLNRLENYGKCSEECFVLALIYIDRITEYNPSFFINPYNIHRLLICSFVISAKFYDEHYFTNSYYAKIGGITLEEMNLLEIEFLRLLDYRLFVDYNDFLKYKEKLLYCGQ